jgi:hypothetical protein
MPSQHHLLHRAVPLALLGCLVIAASVSATGPRTGRVSVSSARAQRDMESVEPSISADGRHVAFYSYATNLVGSDTNGYAHVFVGRAHLPGRSAR